VNQNCGSIVVVDRDPEFRALVSSLLERLGCTTLEAATGEQALAAVRDESPALVLLDVSLPDMTGYEVLRELREEYGDGLAIAFVSGERTEMLDRVGGLLLGADDYLVKPLEANEFLARARRLMHRTMSVARPDGRRSEAGPALTRRECEVLDLLASGLASKEIAVELSISAKTVAGHIQGILTKLGVHSRAQAVAIAHRDHLVGESLVVGQAKAGAVLARPKSA